MEQERYRHFMKFSRRGRGRNSSALATTTAMLASTPMTNISVSAAAAAVAASVGLNQVMLDVVSLDSIFRKTVSFYRFCVFGHVGF